MGADAKRRHAKINAGGEAALCIPAYSPIFIRLSMKHYPTIALLLLFCAGLTGCWWSFSQPRQPEIYLNQKRWAWKPVYAIDSTYRTVSYSEARPVERAGKIYVKDNFIYQCDIGAGIHIIDNNNPATAKRTGFLVVPGCEEISIKGNYLYTNNFYDLVTIDITQFNNPILVSRSINAFFATNGLQHSWEEPKDTGWYQCPAYYMDSVIVNWVKDSVYAGCQKL